MSRPPVPRPASADPAARPRTLGQRLQLLAILLIIPGLAVTLPTVVVSHFFGRKAGALLGFHAKPTPTPDTSGLAEALNRSASTLLPTPAPLSADPIRLTVRPEHVGARAAKVAEQARALGGTAVEGVTEGGEKHLYVDLPGGRAEAFRQAVAANEMPAAPSGSPAAGDGAHDQVEVLIRPVANDE